MELAEKNLTEAEVWYGFLRTPSSFKKLLPFTNGKIDFVIYGEKVKLNYHPQYRRIFGLTTFYKKYNIQSSYKVILKKDNKKYELSFHNNF